RQLALKKHENLSDINDDWSRIPYSNKITDFMTFDEMNVSSFVSMSIYTPFINKGHKNNKDIDDSYDHEINGIVICQVGPTLVRPHFDWKFICIDEDQNSEMNGYGPQNNTENAYAPYLKMWANFFGLPYFPTYHDISLDPEHYVKLDAYKG